MHPMISTTFDAKRYKNDQSLSSPLRASLQSDVPGPSFRSTLTPIYVRRKAKADKFLRLERRSPTRRVGCMSRNGPRRCSALRSLGVSMIRKSRIDTMNPRMVGRVPSRDSVSMRAGLVAGQDGAHGVTRPTILGFMATMCDFQTVAALHEPQRRAPSRPVAGTSPCRDGARRSN
jgi:hypothetical protein